MKFFWQLLVRFLGIYIATAVVFLVPISLIVLGFKWAFSLEKGMSSEEILQIVGMSRGLEGLIVKDECYYQIDGHGCEFVQRFSKEEISEMTKILSQHNHFKDFSKRLIKDKSKNHLVFTKELYRLEPYPIDILVSWDSLNGEVSYKELNGPRTNSLDLLRLFELINFIPKEILTINNIHFLKDGTLIFLEELDNKNLASLIRESRGWTSIRNGYLLYIRPVFVKGYYKYNQLVLYNHKHGAVYFFKSYKSHT